jgi:exopolysaccharide biosynthesis polyprenyl glycosylphosphotransferase
MIPLRRQVLITFLKIYDMVTMVLCFFLAASVVSFLADEVLFSRFLSLRIRVQNFVIFAAFMGAWHIILTAFGLYRSERMVSSKKELTDIAKAISLGTLIIAIVTILFKIKMVTPVFIVVFWVSCTLLAGGGRLFLGSLLRWMKKHGQNLRYMLIVGTNERAAAFAGRMEGKPELGYQIIGFVAEEPQDTASSEKPAGHIVASIEQLPVFVRNHVVDEVVVCLPVYQYYEKIAGLISACQLHGLVVRILPDLFGLKLARSKIEEYEGETVITVYRGEMEGWPFVAKRLMDVSFSLLLLFFLAPVFAVAAILVIDSRGPAFFIQERVGLSKRLFRMYKFRTMVPRAEEMLPQVQHLNEVKGPAFKITDDPRVTALGRYLRRTKIDELPQLINVLKGDMSLVGPRPLPMRDYEGFGEDWQRRRFSVRPGMTCLWQVSGQHAMSFEEWMELDMEYIDRWSLWLDAKILLKTIPVTLKGRY